MKDFWNDRFKQKEFAYGKQANVFLQEELAKIPPGSILFPAEGEGRNAVFAAISDWNVKAFDWSEQGKKRALGLAKEWDVNITYDNCSFLKEEYLKEEFDVISSIFVHYDPAIKTQMHSRLDSYLKVGGKMIMEVFSKEHLALSKKNPKAGGPPEARFMYSKEEIMKDFPNYEIEILRVQRVQLNEGFGHVGESSVLRFVGVKKENRN